MHPHTKYESRGLLIKKIWFVPFLNFWSDRGRVRLRSSLGCHEDDFEVSEVTRG